MRTTLLFLLAMTALSSSAQNRIYTRSELERLESLGKLWGVVHYFHPAMGSGRIVTDSLIVGNAASLAANPSADNFRSVLQDMLGRLNDPVTTLASAPSPTRLQRPTRPSARRFTDGTWYLAMPTAASADGSLEKIADLNPMAWDSARSLIIDIRNGQVSKEENENGDANFMQDLLPVLQARLAGNASVGTLAVRRPYHQGFVNQFTGSSYIYSSGWQIASKGSNSLPPNLQSIPKLGKPAAIVVDGATTNCLLRRLLQLQAAGACQVVFDGNAKTISAGDLIRVPLADGLVAQVRVNDYLVDGATLPAPALALEANGDDREEGSFVKAITRLLHSGNAGASSAVPLTTAYQLPLPGQYPEAINGPSVGLRLLGLYNFWNAIHYFYPYKRYLPEAWDGQLIKMLPEMLAADDGMKYTFALRAAVSAIHDSHGFVQNVAGKTPIRDSLGYWPPLAFEFIGGKCYIVDIGKDSAQDLSGVALWDEVVAVDGMPLLRYVELFRRQFATSNESTFFRDISFGLLGGPLNSTHRVQLRRGDRISTVTLRCTGRGNGIGRQRVDFNDDHRTVELLPGNIGYVNMGSLEPARVDSMLRALQHTRAIIFDVRNYPKGTAWSIAPRLAVHDTDAVRFVMPLVDHNHVTGGEEKLATVSGFTVIRDTLHPSYTGKIVLLCNQQTQSQAEYSIMMLQAAARATVIGSQTAGADGDVTAVVWPGGYRTSFSGLEILYPDGARTQRSGIRVDIQVKPTIDGLKSGKDEVLERAIRFVNTGK